MWAREMIALLPTIQAGCVRSLICLKLVTACRSSSAPPRPPVIASLLAVLRVSAGSIPGFNEIGLAGGADIGHRVGRRLDVLNRILNSEPGGITGLVLSAISRRPNSTSR